MTYAVIMVRSSIDVKPRIGHTLKMLRLHHINHCVLVPEDEYHKGMLRKVKDYVTWGEVDDGTIGELISKRGRVLGNDGITDEFLKKNTPFKSIGDLSKAISQGETALKELDRVKPVFRLSPPRKGWGGIKRAHKVGGALGYRGGDMGDLIGRMV